MAKVTPAQRRAFWAYVRLPGVGINRARGLMKEVTKGITSLRHPRMTPWKMSMVLKTFAHYFGKSGNTLCPGPGEVLKGKKIIPLRTWEQKQEIQKLQAALGWDSEKYHSLCRLAIGRHEPLSQDEAARVIQEMQKILKAANRC